jgi:transcriptional regulator with XRE-family HTH domain
MGEMRNTRPMKERKVRAGRRGSNAAASNVSRAQGDSRNAAALDVDAIASEWVRQLRGKRSRAAFSRRLGYHSNVVHRWENKSAWPTASRFLEVCEQCGKDVGAAYQAFFMRVPSWSKGHAPASPGAVAAFLRQLQGKTKIVSLAESSGFSRYSIARWLSADAEPKLPEFLRLIEASSRRALDFIATFTDPSSLPSARVEWESRERLRRAAYEETWSHAVLRALELTDHPQSGDPTAWLARVLGIDAARVQRSLAVLESTGQVARRGDHWVALPAPALTTGRHPATLGILTRAWTQVAIERIEKRVPSHFGYSLFAVSRKDLRRLRDMQLEYLREMQAIIARSTPNECVGLFCLHLLDLSASEDNAFAE